MKRTQPDDADSRATSRRRVAAIERPRQYVRPPKPHGERKIGPESAAPSLFASWSRAERGQGSEADAALWQRFAVFDPADPEAVFRFAARLGMRPSALVFQLHETLWRALSESPTVNQYLGDRASTPLPAFADLIEGAAQLWDSDRVSDVVPHLLSADRETRNAAVKTLVDAMARVLRDRPMVEWMATDAPFYATPMPLGSWAPALHALGARCNYRRPYYVLVMQLDDNSIVALLSAPPQGADRDRSLDAIWHIRVRETDTTDKIDSLARLASAGRMPKSNLPSDLAKWLPLFLAAVAYMPEWASVPWLDPTPAGAAQVRAVLTPLPSVYAIPPTTMLASWIADNIPEDTAIRALSGAWIDECQLVVALTVFAGQAAARRLSPLFGGRPLTLFDAAIDAAAASLVRGGDRPVLPHDVIERSAPRLWQRVCSAPAITAGTLVGAELLPQAARAVGVPVGRAETDRPELLCASLIARLVPEQAMARYGLPITPAPARARPMVEPMPGSFPTYEIDWQAYWP
ncbi:hypothetical protein pqer_cds_506 [Pandoravirus quercus]|uniref:Uncharacterized protein n=2 Tax=Pandoravirus TaxID=2060084 RepID=A0A2U7U8Z9_9VIRU|nr:hypothetical protein pqer_cds_506 [Pandoravirus quercus]AVK74928.1 hypothetical protein pqer_cds_506 [Pandoravirus quercus]QBZ81115.1 hypothetical protein pclt_cds_521 [Pandoravirus celtis]